jgi:hypothetical protein
LKSLRVVHYDSGLSPIRAGVLQSPRFRDFVADKGDVEVRLIESIEDQMRGVVTYELPNGQRACFDARTVQKYGLAELMRAEGLGEFVPTERLPVMHHGERVGTMSPEFDPNNVKSLSFMYDPRPGDFKREGDVWVAARTLGYGDLEAISGFERDKPHP